ncbi:ATP synthase subunit delta, mitochondrial [Hyalella azteca]|uniref:F-ATPase delta subunit n=1 Tax=Hyalella azteca TaxID=294128 RepID=A0A8B7N3W5_HYAAZ|nr:ATP synthase subunit delta, mitochondrial [Hyalella azteca]
MFVRSTAQRLVHQLPRMMSRRNYADLAMAFTFASQNQVFYNQADVKQVDVPSFSGSFGILPAHVPSLAVLKPGVVTVYEQSGSAKKIFVSSGIVTINEDSSVQLLAEEAVGVAELDVAAAREVLSKSQGAVAAAASEEAKAEALIAVEVAEELVKAAEA